MVMFNLSNLMDCFLIILSIYTIILLLIMQKLGQIQLEKTVTVKVECNLNDEIVVKNFKIIMDCLKDLNASQTDLASRLSKVTDRVSSLEKQGSNNSHKQSTDKSKQQSKGDQASSGLSESEKQNLLNLIKQLDKRTTENEKNILGNTTDINLINKQIQDLKDALGKIKLSSNNSATASTGKDNSGANQETISNINKQMQNNKQLINKTNEELEKLRKQLANMKQKLNRLLEDQKKDGKNTQSNSDKGKDGKDGDGDLNKAELNQLKEKISILNKKTNGLELLTEELKNQTASLGEGQEALENNYVNLKKQVDELKQKLSNLIKNSKNSDKGNSIGSALDSDELRKLKNQIKELRLEIEDLKRDNNSHSKTSIDDEKKRFDRGNLTQAKFKDDSLKDLIARIEYLEKMLGSKNSIGDEKDKLPVIKRTRGKQRDTSIQDKSTSKKDISDIKAQLQAWLNNYLMEMKSKDSLDDIQLKLQEIKNSLGKKADQEGLRKGLSFLQNKINQLYLFLTEPDGDDAMIVRKGFNCLSCSKKVQKLRGKLGPHINWNNMTSTNYSPPKVGYSRHMGENSAEKQDDQ